MSERMEKTTMTTKVVTEEMRKTEEDAVDTRTKKKSVESATLSEIAIAATDVMKTRFRSDPEPLWSTETTIPIITPGPTATETPPVWTIETPGAEWP